MDSVLTSTSLTEVQLFDFPVHLIDRHQALDWLAERLERREATQVVTLNPEMIMQSDADPALRRIVKQADLVIPDGIGLVWALRQKGYPARRLPGIELSEALLNLAEKKQYRVAIVGAKPDVLETAVDHLKERLPRLDMVYYHHGFFATPDEEAAVAGRCAEGRPDLLLVAMGVPRQEKWIDQYRDLFPHTVMIGVGGSLDVWSGVSRRAPGWMRRWNLEWLYRITTEPWRIRRIYKTLPLFVVKVILSKV